MGDNKIPENFQKIMIDMTEDFTETFPEYSELWQKWNKERLNEMNKEELEIELKYLYDYVVSVYPERFFDIIYQNDKIFDIESESGLNVNTLFLPGIDFKLLFNCTDISDETRKVMWNYLKLILLTIVGSVKDKSNFGGTGNLFDGVDETELFKKLSETMSGMGDFFKNMGQNTEEGDETPEDSGSGLPNVDDIFGHLKGLFDGKIGTLAKSLAEEISGDLNDILGTDDIGDVRSTKDVIGKLMKNPAKISGLLKTINDRLQSKISSGEISQEELMKEAAEIMSKMKGLGGEGGAGDVNFEDLFKNMSKMGGMGGMQEMLSKMGGLAGDGGFDIKELMKTMGGIMDPNKNKRDRNNTNVDSNVDVSKMSLHEKMKNRILIKKIKDAEKQLVIQNQIEESQKNYVPYDFGEDDKKVFKINGEERQETSLVSSAPKNNKKKKPKNKK